MISCRRHKVVRQRNPNTMIRTEDFRIDSKQPFRLKDYQTETKGSLDGKSEGKELLQSNIERMMDLQSRLYAENRRSLLLVLQAMDAAGKDGTIKHVMEGLNPQGTEVHSFKQPSPEELDHDFLWRIHKRVPERGRIGIFNRSHYEDVLVVRLHDYAKACREASGLTDSQFWKQRFRQIRDFERHLTENGTTIVKVFLHLSKEEQKDRFLDRIDDPAKNWKFSDSDIRERKHWDRYQRLFQDAIRNTATPNAPWYIVPADKKWFSRALVSQILVDTLETMNPQYPTVSEEQKQRLQACREQLTDKNG
jgi:PPK2 family polyphosphate:nucleotide phosphotransferase